MYSHFSSIKFAYHIYGNLLVSKYHSVPENLRIHLVNPFSRLKNSQITVWTIIRAIMFHFPVELEHKYLGMYFFQLKRKYLKL